MSYLKKYLKVELDTEVYAGIYGMGMIFFYGLELYIYGVKSLEYSVIFQMFLLGYIIAWIQRLLFIKNKIYKGFDYKIRAVLWSILPILLTGVWGFIFNWYGEYPDILWIIFLTGMLGHYVVLWILLQTLYEKETEQLNTKLALFKKENKREWSKCKNQ